MLRRTLAVSAILSALGWSHAHPHDRQHPTLDNWFQGLRNKTKVACCDGSDALRVEDPDWDSKDGHFRVRLEGEWIIVPDDAVLAEPNRAGPTLVWPWRVDGKLNRVRCFMVGAQG